MDGTAWLSAPASWADRVIERTGMPVGLLPFVLVLLAGLATAAIARRVTHRLVLRGASLFSRFDKNAVASDADRLARPIATAVFWLIALITVMTATEMSGLPVVTSWLSRVASYVPQIAAALVIMVFGTLLSRLARQIIVRAARSAHLPAAERFGRGVEWVLLAGVGLVAIDQLGIEVSLLAAVLLIVLAALFGGAALAFGLGGREWVQNVLSAHYVGKMYQVGQTIRVGEIGGRILRITETSVVLESDEGEITLPARHFSTTPSTLVLKARLTKQGGT